jgi:hypothetical protein
VPDEEDISVDGIDLSHCVKQLDNEAWKNKRMEWTHAMWEARLAMWEARGLARF